MGRAPGRLKSPTRRRRGEYYPVLGPAGLCAVRAHQAKHESACALCPRIIANRERIVEVPGGWAHLDDIPGLDQNGRY